MRPAALVLPPPPPHPHRISAPTFQTLLYSRNGACSQCPAGTWSLAQASSCTSCPPGTYSATLGATSAATCLNCPAGSASATAGAGAATACATCLAGTWAAAGSTSCSGCYLGTYSTATGLGSAAACTPCPAGSYAASAGGSSLAACTKCAAGTFSAATGATSAATCAQCSPGSYSLLGVASCTACGPGTWSGAGAGACTSCPASTFSSSSSATSAATCLNCVAGTYSVATGLTAQVSCLSCAAGTYTAGTAPYQICTGAGCVSGTACMNCAAGTYSTTFPGTGPAVCLACPAGTYSANAGASALSACLACPAGTWSAASATACTPCVAGTYSTATSATSAATCTACAAGTYSTTVGAGAAALCLACPAGTYSTTTGNSVITLCTSCPSGTFSAATGQTSAATCANCVAGKYSLSVPAGGSGPITCTSCPAGTWSSTVAPTTGLAACTACAPGTASATVGASTNTCVACIAGQWAAAGAGACTPCAAGYYSAATSAVSIATCIACPQGTYSTAAGGNSLASCTNCAAGTASSGTAQSAASACVQCPAGTYAIAGAGSCTGCAPGYFSATAGAQSSSACVVCPAGTYAANLAATGSASCTQCNLGTYSAATGATSAATCTNCVAGTASGTAGATSAAQCLACGPGTFSLAGQSSCSACPAGTWSSASNVQSAAGCTQCVAGTASSATGATAASTCVGCTYGTYALAGQGSCSNCPPGTYNANVNNGVSVAAACTACPGGTYSAAYGATSPNTCKNCPAGTSSSVGAGSVAACAFCAPGSFAPMEGSTSCASCAASFFCDVGATTNTTTCPAGYYCPGGAAVPCPQGTFSNTTGATSAASCISCPAGFYGPAVGAAYNSSCVPCPAGMYSSTPGITSSGQCLSCAAGTFCPAGSKTNTVTTCPAGYYCAANSTVACPAGTFSSATGQTTSATCTNCGAGMLCAAPGGATLGTVTCPAGWACPGGGVASFPCAPGTYNPATGQASCQTCSAGSLSTVYGATTCTSCPLGSYSEVTGANLQCSPCPANTFSNFVGAGGATSSAYCQPCPTGFTSQPGAAACTAIMWTPVTPPFPLTGRSVPAVAANASAIAIVGGVQCSTLACIGGLSELSLGYDVNSGALIETHTALGSSFLSTNSNLTFDRAAQSLSPIDGTTVYVFGGMSSGSVPGYPAAQENNLLWTLTAATGGLPTATLLASCAPAAAGVSCPTPRKSAGLAFQVGCPGTVGNCLVLVGGDAAGQPVADVAWVFDLSARAWMPKATASTNAPSPRTGLALQASPNSSMVYAFGGSRGSSAGAVNDVFVLSPTSFSDAKPYSEMVNLAQGKYTLASSIDQTWGATNGAAAVVDGSIASLLSNCLNTYDNDQFTTPTGFVYGGQGTVSPFFMVDLGAANTPVDFISVYLRADCCQNRNSAFQIWTSNSNASSWVTSPTPPALSFSAPVGATQLVTAIKDPGLGGPWTFPTPGLKARYIWWVLPGPNRFLTICELQAWQKVPWTWRQLSGTYNAALQGKATESSALSGWGDGQALRAVDGMATNQLDNAEPYTVAHTTSNDVPGPWWQVDFGQIVDVTYINVFGRNDCCQGRNQMFKYSIGNSQDWLYDSKCQNPPASVTPPCYQVAVASCASTPGCFTPGMTTSSVPTPYSFQGQTNAPVPASTQVVVPPGVPQTACYQSFACPLQGRYLTVWKNTEGQYSDSNIIMMGEIQAIANKLLNMPSPRAYMAASAYSSYLVLFGGADTAGFRTNDVSFFDMLTNQWLAPFTPLGTTPAPRASAVLALLPPRVFGTASNSFALFGGFGNAQQLNDFNTLSFPQCAPLVQAGVQSWSCGMGGTVCYPTCFPGIARANGADPLVP